MEGSSPTIPPEAALRGGLWLGTDSHRSSVARRIEASSGKIPTTSARRLLADLLRMGSLPESWIPPHSTRELRELVRYRHKLSQFRTGLKNQVHTVLGKEGVIPHLVELWGPAGGVLSLGNRAIGCICNAFT